jgi:hypothetical protein
MYYDFLECDLNILGKTNIFRKLENTEHILIKGN